MDDETRERLRREKEAADLQAWKTRDDLKQGAGKWLLGGMIVLAVVVVIAAASDIF